MSEKFLLYYYKIPNPTYLHFFTVQNKLISDPIYLCLNWSHDSPNQQLCVTVSVTTLSIADTLTYQV